MNTGRMRGRPTLSFGSFTALKDRFENDVVALLAIGKEKTAIKSG